MVDRIVLRGAAGLRERRPQTALQLQRAEDKNLEGKGADHPQKAGSCGRSCFRVLGFRQNCTDSPVSYWEADLKTPWTDRNRRTVQDSARL